MSSHSLPLATASTKQLAGVCAVANERERPVVVHARVRDANNTYMATHRGLRASSTAGYQQAAEALARKVFPGREVRLELVSDAHADRLEIWSITA